MHTLSSVIWCIPIKAHRRKSRIFSSLYISGSEKLSYFFTAFVDTINIGNDILRIYIVRNSGYSKHTLHVFTIIFLFLQSTSAANFAKIKSSTAAQEQNKNAYARANILNDWKKNEFQRTTRCVDVGKQAWKASKGRCSKCQIGDHDDHFGEFIVWLFKSLLILKDFK